MFSIFGTVLYTSCLTPPPLPPKQGFAQGPHKGMPELSEEDIKMIEEYVNKLTPEEMNELAQFAEEIFKEAEALGIDPFEYAEMLDSQNFAELPEIKPPVIAQPEEPRKVDTVIPSNEKLIENIQKQLHDLITVLNAITADLLENKLLKNKFAQYCKYTVDDLIFYIQLLAKESVLQSLLAKEKPLNNQLRDNKLQSQDYMSTPSDVHGDGFELDNTLFNTAQEFEAEDKGSSEEQKFESFRSHLSTFYLQLSALEKELEVREFNIYGEPDANEKEKGKSTVALAQQKKRKAEEVLDQIISVIQANKGLVIEAQSLLKKYEPEALKLKAESDRLETEARKAQELALTKWVPNYDFPAYWPDFNSSYTGSGNDFTGGYPSYDNNTYTPPSFTSPGKSNDATTSGLSSPERDKGKSPNSGKPDDGQKKPTEGNKPGSDKNKDKDKEAADKGKEKTDPKSKPATSIDIDTKLKVHDIQSKFNEIALIASDGKVLIEAFPKDLSEDYLQNDFDITKRQLILESLGKAFNAVQHAINKELKNPAFKTDAALKENYIKQVENAVKQFEASPEFKNLIHPKLVQAITLVDTRASPIQVTVGVPTSSGTVDTLNVNNDKLFIYFGDSKALEAAPALLRVPAFTDISTRNVDKLVDAATNRKAPTNFYALFRNGYDAYQQAYQNLLALKNP